MLQSLSQVPILFISVDDVHFKRQSHIVEGMLRTAIIFVSPVEVETFYFVFVVQGTAKYVRETEALLFFFRTVFRDGQRNWNGKLELELYISRKTFIVEHGSVKIRQTDGSCDIQICHVEYWRIMPCDVARICLHCNERIA